MSEMNREYKNKYFDLSELRKSQRVGEPFYPQDTVSFKNGSKNRYAIAKQVGEVRAVGCNFAFVAGEENDRSSLVCMRLIEDGSEYRRVVPYIETFRSKIPHEQAVRVCRLYNDFDADYIVLDYTNYGLSIYDEISHGVYDEEREVEYAPMGCMNNKRLLSYARDVGIDAIDLSINLYGFAKAMNRFGINPCIYAVQPNQMLNSKVAIDFKKNLTNDKIDFLTPCSNVQNHESPFAETEELINEMNGLTYELKDGTGTITLKENAEIGKDRYSSCSYCSYFASQLERAKQEEMAEFFITERK